MCKIHLSNNEIHELTDHDVFKIKYKPNSDNKTYSEFEGIVVGLILEEPLLIDTYHGILNVNGKKFKIKTANKIFDIEFLFNMNQVDEINKEEYYFYNKKDVFKIPSMHYSEVKFFKKKNASVCNENIKNCYINKLNNLIKDKEGLEKQINEVKNKLENFNLI